MKRFFARLSFVAIFSALAAGCIAPGGWGGPMYGGGGGWGNGGFGRSWGPGFVGNNGGWGQQQGWGGGWQQPMNVQPGGGAFVGPNGMVQGGWNQTPMAAQQRAQMQAAGVAPPVPAYPNPAMPMGYQVGTGAPVYSPSQCWSQGCVMP